MARRVYKRDSKGRFASVGARLGGPKQKLAFAVAYHGTSRAGAAAIRSGGYRASAEGAQGAGVYLSSSRKQAASYGEVVLRHRVPKARVTESKPLKTAASVKRRYADLAADKAVKVIGTKDKIVLTSESLANRTLTRQSSTIRRHRRR